MNDMTRPDDPDALRRAVSQEYTRIAETDDGCGCGCAPAAPVDISRDIGYTEDELASIPAGADLGLGCGAPISPAELGPGDVVLDLGSGAGLDAFLAAGRVGPEGRVIGVDMTNAMLAKARANAERGGYDNVEFRKGLIEDLPLDDESVDVILSNCVINLSPEKDRVFRDAYRVLRPGGRMVVSDIVLEEALPPEIARRVDATIGCVGNASVREDYLRTVREAGFTGIETMSEINYGEKLIGSSLASDLARAAGLSLEEIAVHLGKVTSLTLRICK